MPPTPFILEALVDFPDDALIAPGPITAAHLDAMMQRLQELGVRRVSWGYYGDGHGGHLLPADLLESDYPGGWRHFADTYRGLGNPLRVAVEAGHRHGLEVYAYFKPYETGPTLMFPEGSPQAQTMGLLPHLGGRLGWLEPFVRDHPELRIKRRTDDLPAGLEDAVITTLRLVKQDDSPTRLTAEHLQIWTSAANWQYQPAPVEFQLAETVEPAPREVRERAGLVLTRAGDPVRVLTMSGLKLTDKFLLITTDFAEGSGDFTNSATALVEARDDQGRVLPVEIATGATIYCPELQNFRTAGLNFDYGWGSGAVTLDAPNADGHSGLIALTRGRNAYLGGALCETEPEVQAFWLRCLEEMIAAGVDGVDFREENHSTMTDRPEDYGFNEVILRQCGDLTGEALLARIAEVRGNAYTEFLRACHQRLTAAGRQMRYNLQVDWLRPNRPRERALAYPAHLDWQWERWITEGLMDAAILRYFEFQPDFVLADDFTRTVLDACQARHLPLTWNRYIGFAGDHLAEEVLRIRQDGRFSGFILYETSAYIQFDAQGGAAVSWEPIRQVRPALES